MIRYLRLSRIGNVIIAFISVECAGILSGVDVIRSLPLVVAAVAASFITAGGNAINDFYDVEIDRINRPGRPLAAGRLSPYQVRVFYFVSTSAGLALSALVNWRVFLIALVAAGLVFAYSFRLKRMVLTGNLCVALVTGMAFIYGGAAVNNFVDVYPAAVFAFLTNVIREVVKDAEDVRGDGAVGITTLATKYGTSLSIRISIALTTLLLFLVWEAYQLGILPIQFLTVCGLTILPIGVYTTFVLITRRGFSEASFGYKLIMIFGLVALIVGKV